MSDRRDWRDPEYTSTCDTCDEEYPECGSEPHECDMDDKAAWADHQRKARMEDGE